MMMNDVMHQEKGAFRREREAGPGDVLKGLDVENLPYSEESERGVISSVLLDPATRMAEVEGKVPVEAFYHASTRLIFEQMLALHRKGKPLDVVMVTNYLRDAGLLERVGGPAAVAELFTYVASPTHFDFYVKDVLDRWARRKLIGVCAQNIAEAQGYGREDLNADVLALLGQAEARVFAVLEGAQKQGAAREGAVLAKTGVARWVDHLQRTIDNRGKVIGLTTGIHEIDMTLHGIDDEQGEIAVIAGRPAMGKTAMGCTIVHHLAVERGIPGLVFSIEMTADQLYNRMILGAAGVDTSKAITGHFSRQDHDRIAQTTRSVQTSPLLVCDSAAVNSGDLRSLTQMAKRQHGIRWILVDHLHLVKSVDAKVQGDERMRLVEVMETLQYLKKEFKLGVFLLVQMNRDTDKNPGKPPVLADLAGSAAIEWFADHVMFIHREEEYVRWHRLSEGKQEAWREQIGPRRARSPELWSDGLKYDEESGGFARQDYEEKAMIYVRKNRRGPTPELQLRYVRELTRFSTRMPCLNSTNPLDWQMGTYTAPKEGAVAKSSAGAGMGPVKPRRTRGGKGSEEMQAVFPDGED